jgi:hypothetical protein
LDARVETPQTESSIGDLFHQLVGDGKAFVSAEVNLYKEIARHRAGQAKAGIVALVAGALLALSGLIAFMVGLVMGLAPLVGPVAGGLIVLAVCGLIAFLLVRFGAARMSALSGTAEEKAALAAGENRP